MMVVSLKSRFSSLFKVGLIRHIFLKPTTATDGRLCGGFNKKSEDKWGNIQTWTYIIHIHIRYFNIKEYVGHKED